MNTTAPLLSDNSINTIVAAITAATALLATIFVAIVKLYLHKDVKKDLANIDTMTKEVLRTVTPTNSVSILRSGDDIELDVAPSPPLPESVKRRPTRDTKERD